MLMLLAEKWTPLLQESRICEEVGCVARVGDGRLARPVEQSETPGNV